MSEHEKQPQYAPPPYYQQDPQQQYGFQIPNQPGIGQGPPPQQYVYPHPPVQAVGSPIVVQPNPTHNTTVVMVGGCPRCRSGALVDDYTCCGILCAILCFPIGILCCLCMKEKRCTNCGATF